ncbi:UNVERIFIED_ORG: pyruvate/2-oxoglutarate dehydrogenase complex dihydrolipoamide acyltransferase (E2) component [Arthrobacter sp. UYEF13]
MRVRPEDRPGRGDRGSAATVWVDVDATALVELRAGLKKSDPHNTPGLLAFIARFVTAGLAILGVGRIIDKPWVVEGELAVRRVTELTLTFDHRVCDGGAAAGFLRIVADAIENPASVLADL